jgi:hypothetical protein
VPRLTVALRGGPDSEDPMAAYVGVLPHTGYLALGEAGGDLGGQVGQVGLGGG